MGGVIMKISKILLAAMVLSTVATGVLAEEVKTWDIVPTNRNANENYHVTLKYLDSRPESYANVDTNLDFIRIHDINDQITDISGGSVSVHSKDRHTHNDLYPGYFSMIGDNNSFEARTGYLRLLNGPENGDTELNGRNITIMSVDGDERYVKFGLDEINAGNQQINNVKAGVADTDAVNVAQLKRLQDQITASSSVTTVTAGDHIKGVLSKMDKRIDKSVAGAAALAALHPLDFDPDAKWDFAAGYGHYRSGDAAAIGAFYRPNEDVQLSIGSTVGSDETVFNAGLSVKVGAHSGVSRSRVAIGKEVLALKKTVAEQNAQIQKLTALLNGVAGTKMKADHTTLFPDVAANHWAYEAVSDLSRRGLVEGYPDGTFGGDRLLTRYEFAQIVYRAIQDGVTVDDRLVTEFSPEMALFRVDTIAKNGQGEPTIERVRVNKK